MCSFLFARTKRQIPDNILEQANAFSRHRGPDRCTVRRETDGHGFSLVFLHNLLDISGIAAEQPVVSGNAGARIIALFNGEIYNYRELGPFSCDTECIVPLYQQAGLRVGSLFDGEFAVVVYDQAAELLTVVVDPFLTKPLYLAFGDDESEIGVATCASSLKGLGFERIVMMQPNTALQFSLNATGAYETQRCTLFPFRVEQTVGNYSGWIGAFREAVRKRATHGAHKPLVFLSSGYDSGAICLALNQLRIPYDTLSIVAGESETVLRERIRINRKASCEKAVCVDGLSPSVLANMSADILENVEPFQYMHEDAPGVITSLQCDGGALGANFLAGQARGMGRVVNLSGAGADEILSDYGFGGEKFYFHSQFGGLFPEDLAGFFPWKKFYGDTQRSYLFKDEFVLGRHGVEGRYPFLGREVVQQFLSLTASLKNACYKAPVDAFLTDSAYPFERSKKRGFSPSAQPVGLVRSLLRLIPGCR
jgi:asparagine synthetase B (glutamine-hydrolysing)